jgi:hypothetical protein
VPGGIAGTSLISLVLVSKFAYRLPLYRLEDILSRHGVSLSRSTLCDWVRNAATVLTPLAELQRTRVLQSDLIWTDDTHVTALSDKTPGSTRARFWAYISEGAAPYSVYDFTMGRARDGPAAFLKDYRGFLQADAYGGYDGIFLGSDGMIVEVACWAHARRKFYEARPNAPREANQVLEWIRQLYDMEDRAHDFTAMERQALRQRESVPILDRLEAYLDELSPRVLPRSALAKALTYARNQRAALRRYVTDGRLTIDNNVSADAAAAGHWPEELGIPGERSSGPASGGAVHDPGGSQAASPGALGLSAGRAAAPQRRGDRAGGAAADRWAAAHPEHVLEHRLEKSRRKAARQKATRERRRAGRSQRS